MAAPPQLGETEGMALLPRSRRGNWLLAGVVWLAACTTFWWAMPARPRMQWPIDEPCQPVGFVAGARSFVTYPLIKGEAHHKREGTYRLWNFDTGEVTVWGRPGEQCTAAAISPMGNSIALCQGGTGAPVRIHDAKTGQFRFNLPAPGPDFTVEGIAISADGQRIACLARSEVSARLTVGELSDNYRETVRVDQSSGFEPIGRRPWGLNRAGNDLLAWSPDGRLLAVADEGDRSIPPTPRVHLWDIRSVQRVLSLNGPEFTSIVELQFSPDGRHVAATFQGELSPNHLCRIYAWSTETGSRTLVAEGDYAQLRPGPWAIDLGRGGAKTRVRVFDFGSDTPRHDLVLDSQEGTVSDGLSKDGMVLAVQSTTVHPLRKWLDRAGLNWTWGRTEYSAIRFVNCATHEEIGRLPSSKWPEVEPHAVWAGFTLDGTAFASCDGATLRVWDLPPRKSLTWFAAGAAVLALPIGFAAWRRGRKLAA